ncbi:unnamed protein product [Eruca vesicaria subsp. sativa]|uniref:J domain-containing protein n=1 Tax=Eruca vesicaria subsp. sativa TaxID=29727 RepID=A0ABC8K8R4_ERUVS|nr:unnamed protein product [Eruca vesicaria subsp. sativa]
MDEFVALTERYGLKPRGKSAPMASLKRSNFNPNTVKASPFDSNAELTLNDSKFDSFNPSGGFDYFLVFDELNKLSTNGSGDDDFLTGLNENGFDELIPGFGRSGHPSNSEVKETESVQVNKQQFGSPVAQAQFLEIKLWSDGKEGNLRALLSSLHLVLWPGCGWEAVSLTDLITSASVKKVYRKATLYVHPDKVQQKDAQQKYIAEKVFSILQEAWNKFKKEELS